MTRIDDDSQKYPSDWDRDNLTPKKQELPMTERTVTLTKQQTKGLMYKCGLLSTKLDLSRIHISEPTRQAEIAYAVFCLKKKTHQEYKHAIKTNINNT